MLTKTLAMNEVEIISIGKNQETLKIIFLS